METYGRYSLPGFHCYADGPWITVVHFLEFSTLPWTFMIGIQLKSYCRFRILILKTFLYLIICSVLRCWTVAVTSSSQWTSSFMSINTRANNGYSIAYCVDKNWYLVGWCIKCIFFLFLIDIIIVYTYGYNVMLQYANILCNGHIGITNIFITLMFIISLWWVHFKIFPFRYFEIYIIVNCSHPTVQGNTRTYFSYN